MSVVDVTAPPMTVGSSAYEQLQVHVFLCVLEEGESVRRRTFWEERGREGERVELWGNIEAECS